MEFETQVTGSITQDTTIGKPQTPPPCLISHITPQTSFSLRIYSGISILKRDEILKTNVGGGLRGKVAQMSRQSRKRLLEKVARCRHMDSGYFGTVTYPGDFWYSWQECKAHLDALRKRIMRKFPHARIIWRMETKPRQSGLSQGEYVPHFHFLMFGIPMGKADKLAIWLTKAWDEIANDTDNPGIVLRCQCEEMRSRKQSVWYCSKYAAKVEEGSQDNFGRAWGFWGGWDETFSSVWTLKGSEVIQFKRLIRSWLKSKGKRSLAAMFASINPEFGLSVFGLGDFDDLTGAKCAMIDFITHAQRMTR